TPGSGSRPPRGAVRRSACLGSYRGSVAGPERLQLGIVDDAGFDVERRHETLALDLGTRERHARGEVPRDAHRPRGQDLLPCRSEAFAQRIRIDLRITQDEAVRREDEI